MDVRMPDGTVIRNVPEGITQADLQRRMALRSPPVAAPEDSQFGQGYRDELVVGMEPTVPTSAPPPQPLAMQDAAPDPGAIAPNPGTTAPTPIRGGFAEGDPRLAGLKPGERQAAMLAASGGLDSTVSWGTTVGQIPELAKATAVDQPIRGDRLQSLEEELKAAKQGKPYDEYLTAASGGVGISPMAGMIAAPRALANMKPRPIADIEKDIAAQMADEAKWQKRSQELAKEMEGSSVWQRGVQQAGVSIPQSATALGVGLVTKNPALAAISMYPTTQAQAYADLRGQGVPHELAVPHSRIQGAAEVGTELIEFTALLNKVPSLNWFLKNVLAEEGGETAAQLIQGASSEIAVRQANGEKITDTMLWDATKIAAAQLPETWIATAMGTAAQTGTVHLVDKVISGKPDEHDADLINRAHEAYVSTLAETMAELSAQKMPQSLRKQEAAKRAQAAALNVVAQFSPVEAAKMRIDKLEQDAAAGKPVDPAELEKAREEHETVLADVMRGKLRSGQLTPEQQQQAAQALHDMDNSPEDGEAGTIPGQVRETAPKPAADTQVAPAAPGAPKAVKPAEPLSEVETARHDALTRVANADTIEETALNELVANGLAKINPQSGRPILLPPGKRQRTALTKRMEAAEEAEKAAKEADKPKPVAAKPQPKSPKKAAPVAVKPQPTEAEAKPARPKNPPDGPGPSGTKVLKEAAVVQVSAVSKERGQAEKVDKPAARAMSATKTSAQSKAKSSATTEVKPAPVAAAPVVPESEPDMNDRDAPEGDFTPSQPIETEAMDEPKFAADERNYEHLPEGEQPDVDHRPDGDPNFVPDRRRDPFDRPDFDPLRHARVWSPEEAAVMRGEKPDPQIAAERQAVLDQKEPGSAQAATKTLLDRPGERDAAKKRIDEIQGKIRTTRPDNGEPTFAVAGGSNRPAGFRQDNPAVRDQDDNGREWLARKQANAEEDMATARKRGNTTGSMGRGLIGSVTAWTDSLDIPVAELQKLQGVNGERRAPGESQYDRLKQKVLENGWKQEWNAMVSVNHKGEAFIAEGNTRTAVAAAVGQPTVRVEIRWYNGGETAKGPFSPENVKRMTEPEEPAFSAAEALPEEGQPLLAPNGKPSKLSRAQWQQVRTKEFKAWFGDWEKFALMQGGVWNDSKGEVSKVVDPETGEPLVVYHGTNKGGFRVFDNDRGAQNTMAPKGTAYFSNARSMARTYTRNGDEVQLDNEAPPGWSIRQATVGDTFVEDGTTSVGAWVITDENADYVASSNTEAEAYHAVWDVYHEHQLNYGERTQSGIYSVFLNIRNPGEEDFEGANWDGTRDHQWEIVRLIDGFRDPGFDPIYAEDGTRYFPDEKEALNVAHAQGLEVDGYEIVPAGWHGSSTDGVTREAMQNKNDGAIIRNVLDEGGYGFGGNDPSDVFVAFNPTQIKSAVWNNGKFDPANEDITFSAAPMFYSALTLAGENAKLAKGTGAQWLSTLRNTPGVKQEEVDWVAIQEWLGDRKGVTKDEVVDYLRAHEITVEETVRGAPRADKSEEEQIVSDASDIAFTEGEDWQRLSNRKQDILVRQAAPKGFFPHPVYGDDPTELIIAANRHTAARIQANPRTKYDRSDLNTPGGMEGQYRELLLRLPESRTKATAAKKELVALREEVMARTGLGDAFAAQQAMNADERARYDEISARLSRPDQQDFTSGHWDEENVLAHVRFTSRNDVGTGTTLFIEEIQSDWHQKGRKQGYAKKEDTAGWKAERLNEPDAGFNHWRITDADGGYVTRIVGGTEESAIRKAAQSDGVPDAPFKTTWPELAMKRIIRWAAENGYDQVAWTSGEMQAERYNLGKHVDRIVVWKSARSGYELSAFKDNENVLSRGELSKEQLAELIGKDAAEKALAKLNDETDVAQLEGLDLQVGGRGMQGFYDKILVAAADKLGKKYGTKTGQTPIGGVYGVDAVSGEMVMEAQGIPHDQRAAHWRDLPDEDRVQQIKDYRARMKEKRAQVHVMRMTPELKTAALGGFPMFAAAKSKPVGNMNVSQVEALIPPIEAAMGVPIGVVQTQEELPPHLAIAAMKKNARSKKGFHVAGVFDDTTGKLWLVAGNLENAAHAIETAYHEIEHKGLRYLLGANYGSAMEEIIRSFPDDVLKAQKKNQIGVDENGKLADFKDLPEAKRHLSAEEAVAYAAGSLLLEKGGKDERGRWRKMIDTIRRYLREHGVPFFKTMNKNDLNDLIYRAAIAAGQAQANLKYAADVADARAKGTPIPKPNPVNDGPLLGMPTKTDIPGQGEVAMGPHKPARRAAADYKNKAKLRYADVRTYAKVNPATGKRIADAYRKMKHDPLNPRVKAAYAAMIKETLAQYQAIKATGLRVEFIPTGQNPYAASPRMAIEDVRNNNHLWVFPTDDGFGAEGEEAAYRENNPLLEKTDEYVGQKRLLANDVFRIVHDYFGHIKEGNGFRHDGEENAWRIHSTMYSPLARAAMTSETRGQNSELNWGQHGEKNRKANSANTIYAPQKIGLLPPEFWNPEPEIAHATDPAFSAEEPKKRRYGFYFGKLPDDVAKLALERAQAIVKKPRLGKGTTLGGSSAHEIKFERMYDSNPKFNETMKALRDAGFHPDVVMGGAGGWLADSAFIGDMTDEEPAFSVADDVRDTIREIAGSLTDEERQTLNRSTAKKLVKLFDSLPDEKERGAVALAGAAAKGWYRDSAETIADIFGADSPRFAALLAALSPQVDVQHNLSNAVGVWTAWVKAGKPTGKKEIKAIMTRSLWGAASEGGKKGVLPAWINNTVRALASANPESIILSGPKVSSFAANLRGEVNEVTLDSWMAAFDKLDADKFFKGGITKKGPGKRAGYLAVSARVRQTAAYLTKKTGEVWTPAEVQETIWSWTKTLAELSAKYGSLSSAEEIVKNGELTNELVNATTNFATLFALPEHQEALRALGYGGRLDRADARAKARASSGRQAPSLSGADQKRVLTAARRLDARREEDSPNMGRMGASRMGDDELEHAFSVLGGNTGDPKLDAFMGKIGSKRRTLGQWWADTTENLGNRIRYNAADDLWGIGAAGQTAGLSLADVGYKNAQLARNAAELTQLVFEEGVPVWHRDGTHEVSGIDTSGGGFIDIIAPLEEKLNLFFAWKIARRADRLMGEGRENWFTQDEIDAAKDLHLQHPEFVTVDAKFVAFKNKVLDFAQEAGVIDPAGRALWEHDDYIPFYRIIESAQNRGAIDAAATNALGKVRNQVRRLKGGRAQLGDPLENIAKNWLSLIDASLKAHAARTVIDALDGTGLVTKAKGHEFMTPALIPLTQVKDFIANNPLLAAHLKAAGIDPALLPPAAFAGLQKMFGVKAPEGDDIATIWRNGKREYWHVHDDLLLQSLLNIPKAAWGPWMEFFRFPKRVFTATTTVTPQFGIRNIYRDTLHVAITGAIGRKTTIIPGWDTVKGALSYIRRDQDAIDMMAAGGSFTHGYIRGGDMSKAGKHVRRSIKRHGALGTLLNSPVKVVRFYRDFLNDAENSNRVAMYQSMLKAGASRLDAAYEARDLLDFNKQGANNLIRFIVQSVPFWNARLQGLDRIYRGPAGVKGVFFSIALRGAMYTMAMAALMSLYYDDDRYKKLTPADKANFIHLFDVFSEGDHYTLPVPFEMGTLFGTIPLAIYDYMVTNADEPDRMKQSLELVGSAFMNTLNMRPDIAATTPLMELAINKDLYTQAPILNQGDADVLPEEQDDPRVGATYRLISRLMPDAAPDALRSPKQFMHLARGYVGNVQDYLLMATDAASRRVMGEPEPQERQNPFFAAFKREGPERLTKHTVTMYEVADEANRLASSIDRLEKAGTDEATARIEELQEDNAPLLNAGDAFGDATKSVGEIRKNIRQVQLDPDMTPAEKKEEIDAMQEQINEIALDVWDLRPGGKLNAETAEELLGEDEKGMAETLRRKGFGGVADALEALE